MHLAKLKLPLRILAALAAGIVVVAGAALAAWHPPEGDALGAVAFGPVWCPSSTASGAPERISDYRDLPNDPIMDGTNGCYMEAFDTSVFSTDDQPVRSCRNLDLKRFPRHRCIDIKTPQDYKSLALEERVVGIVVNDLVIERGLEPYIAGQQESLVVIGTYDPRTLRPVQIRTGTPAPSTLLRWNSRAEESAVTVINLRMLGANCLSISDLGLKRQLVAVSVTGKCSGRFLLASPEPEEPASPVDNAIYLKNIMARAKNSHTVYLDRTWLNWIEDSVVMGPWMNGKHAVKYTGQNVVIRNGLYSNEGVHGHPIEDPSWDDPEKPWQGKGGLAPISMASCNRAVIDGVTVVNHVVRGNSNPQAIQWQFRDALGAGCDLPRIYHPPEGASVPQAWYGPTWYAGRIEEPSSAWSESFWERPAMLESWVVDTQIKQTYGKGNAGHGRYFALMADGTFPAVRDSPADRTREPPARIPPGWIERQRIHVSGNCLDNGIARDSLFSNHVVPGMGRHGRHLYDDTDRFERYGRNSCRTPEEPDPQVQAAKRAYLDSLPPPPWTRW